MLLGVTEPGWRPPGPELREGRRGEDSRCWGGPEAFRDLPGLCPGVLRQPAVQSWVSLGTQSG